MVLDRKQIRDYCEKVFLSCKTEQQRYNCIDWCRRISYRWPVLEWQDFTDHINELDYVRISMNQKNVPKSVTSQERIEMLKEENTQLKTKISKLEKLLFRLIKI